MKPSPHGLGLPLLLALAIRLAAETVEVNGVVVDDAGRPVAGVSIGDWWLSANGRLEGTDATTDGAGQFRLRLELDGAAEALLAVDGRQERGGLVTVTRATAGQPVTIRLAPLIRVRGEYFCDELQEAPGWCNTQVWFTTNRFRIQECRSDEARFELKLPPGDYVLNGYDGDMVFGFKRPITLTAGQPLVDLGRISLRATPMALSWGKRSPEWHLTEARGLATNATVAGFRGRWLLLDFWGYWCGPCVVAMPGLFDFYDRHAAARTDFEIVAVHNGARTLQEMDQRLTGIIRSTWKGRTLPFPVLVDGGETTFDNFGIRAYPTQLLIDPDGRVVRDGAVDLLETILQQRRSALWPLALAPDGDSTAQGRADGKVHLRPAGDGKDRIFRAGRAAINALAFSPDGRRLATGARDGAVAVWDVASGRELIRMSGGGAPVFAVRFSPDGRRLATAGWDTTRVWNLADRTENPDFARRLFPAWSLAFSPDGGRLAAGGAAAVLIRDAATGAEIATCRNRGGGLVRSVHFTPDGRSLITGIDHRVATWDAAQGTLGVELGRMASEIAHVTVSGDGGRVTALTRGKAVRTWSMAGETRLAAGAIEAGESMTLLVPQLADEPGALASEVWAICRSPGRPAPEYEDAVKRARRAVRLAPRDPWARRALGAALYRAGRPGEAWGELSQVIESRRARDEDRMMRLAAEALGALALHRMGREERARVLLLDFWGKGWPKGHEDSGLLDEVSGEFFGPGTGQARPLVLGGLRSGAEAAQVRAGVEINPDWDATTRAAALRLLPMAEALVTVERSRRRLGRRDRVVAAVAESRALDPLWRAAALQLARQTREDGAELNAASWAVVAEANRSVADYALALEQAEAAYRLAPGEAVRNTLGVALYRVGRYRRAVAILSQSERHSPDGIADASDLPFLAMAYHRMGRPGEARERFAQWVALLLKDERVDLETLAFLREAEGVLGLKAPTALAGGAER